MPINFPGGHDDLTNPVASPPGSETLASMAGARPHSEVISTIQDILEAIETYLSNGVSALGSAAFTNSAAYDAAGAAAAVLSTSLQKAANLSDLANVITARANLGGTAIGQAYFTETNPGAITFVRQNADNTISALTAANFRTAIGAGTGSGDALTTNPLSQFAATTSAQLAGVISDETGSGALVFGTSPTFTTQITTPLVLTGDGTEGSPGYAFSSAATWGMSRSGSIGLVFSIAGAGYVGMASNGVFTRSDKQFFWCSTAAITATVDTGLARSSAGVVKVTDGSSGSGSLTAATLTASANGAASLPAVNLTGTPFAGTGTTSFPLLYLNQSTATASTTLNTAGTFFGINSHGSQDLVNLMVDGVSRVKIASTGALTIGGVVLDNNIGITFANTWRISGASILPILAGDFLGIGSAYTSYNIGVYTAGVGGVTIGSGLNNNTASTATLDVIASGSTRIAQIVKGAASRSVALLQLQTSVGASLGNVGGCIFDDYVSASTTSVDGTFDTILTHTTVANSLAVNGDKIEMDCVLTFAAHALSTDQVKVSFGGINIFDSGANNFALAGVGRLYVQIIRKSSTTCRAIVEFIPTGSATIFAFSKIQYTAEDVLISMTLTGTNILAVTAAATGTNSASGDVTMVMGSVDIIPAGS